MSKKVTVKTSTGAVLYKISEYSGKYYCAKDSGSFFSNWYDIGSTRSMDDALTLIKSHARKYGTVYKVYID